MGKNIVIASDHGGVSLKSDLIQRLEAAGHVVKNLGVDEETSVDYPDIAETACKEILIDTVDCGILICGTGLGISIAANKINGIRAALCGDSFTARMAREHNNANVLVLGARVIGSELAWDIVTSYLSADFSGGRHQKRVDKITALEEN